MNATGAIIALVRPLIVDASFRIVVTVRPNSHTDDMIIDDVIFDSS